ncbi:protein O-mannosyl-transferase family [Mucilaginibacter lappiensis]|uniref:protein O-mannosyl-transferase family n=1 Tax=Mucilaginibacter lappiensis TaxID=354630 RepID=UPI003D1E07CC
MSYNKINNIFGWIAFIIASLTYILTLEQSSSFWDCGEFIACIYRLQVAHQPGAPLFTIIGKVFTLLSLGDVTKVAYWANMASALASGATIMFLFWTVTALAKKLLIKKAEDLNQANLILIIGAGLVGALAYAWSDTFWFSAVESEVYAQSSLCTAIVFWAILKWDAHADEQHADKWIVFIAYVMGLSIGIHLLNLLVIPAIALVIYFRKAKTITTKGTFWAFFAGIVAVAFVLWGVIQYTVKGAAFSDLLFVNTLGMGFGSGAVMFFVLLLATIVSGIYYTVKPSQPAIIVSAVCFILVLGISAGIVGFIVGLAVLAFLEYVVKIRERRFALNTFLICLLFILFGYSSFVMIVVRAKANPNLNNSDPENAFALNGYLNRDQYGDTPLLYGQFFDSQPTAQTEGANIYRRGETKYEIAGKKLTTVYDRNTPFPRMFSDKAGHPEFYRAWSKLGQSEQPTFATNLGFFASWQINQMYTRYFLWNFVGRTNDLDGQTSNSGIDGNWISGWNFNKPLPYSVTESKSYNRLYYLPLIIGLIGLFFHFIRDQRNAGVVGVLFFFTGIAIVLYLNQDPLQPRERDYAYAGSFYAFAIWIGIGVLAIADFLSKKLNPKISAIIATVVCLLAAPVLMANQEWDDHDRSTKLTPHDMAYNYLNSCAPNAILFTYGDNDTYPLWYIQEVEQVRPDVRIVNLSLLGTDWYIRGMKNKMNQSEPLPISMPNDKFKPGVRDVIYFNDQKVAGTTELKEVFDFITSDDKATMVEYNNGDVANYLPTKNFKLTVNPDEVVQTGTVSAAEKAKITPEMDWTFNGRYVTKDVLAMIDILSHNNWKRPIYFSVTVPNENMIGLDKYLYNEGFAYRLLPFKPDTAASPLETSHTPEMYHNIMTKFKWGNMKNARYLDHESMTMFYPLVTRLYSSLADNLMKEGHLDQAKGVLKKYDDVMPGIIPSTEVAVRKYYMTESAYRLGDIALANKLANQVDDYVTNLLDYNYALLQRSETELDNRDIQYSMSILSGLASFTKDFKQTSLNTKFNAQLKNYEGKFGTAPKQ